jgi:hypothetical protein
MPVAIGEPSDPQDQAPELSVVISPAACPAAAPGGRYCGCVARVRKKSSICPIAALNWPASIGLTM